MFNFLSHYTHVQHGFERNLACQNRARYQVVGPSWTVLLNAFGLNATHSIRHLYVNLVIENLWRLLHSWHSLLRDITHVVGLLLLVQSAFQNPEQSEVGHRAWIDESFVPLDQSPLRHLFKNLVILCLMLIFFIVCNVWGLTFSSGWRGIAFAEAAGGHQVSRSKATRRPLLFSDQTQLGWSFGQAEARRRHQDRHLHREVHSYGK